ncbi:GNAT family N-acetyltransferase [Flavobacterium sp. '19STA2R22 D10 B1']|uniref:GNAT family N-acetyltransferase n=1 Tax=Flavobacterium aerium TaxID=3037261 RepID=UPI00278C14D5|nr:GNAT family N-acetyltransferase [Flavobacterium sp. '19STA2R22 D10 B1']
MDNLKINSERLILRSIIEADLEQVHLLHSMEEIDKFNTLGIPESVEETKSILENWITENNKENTQHFTFAIELKTDNQFIGIIGISIGKVKYKNAEVWFKFDPKFWNKGYATEALNEILSFGFTNLKLHRIEAGCAVGNIGSMKVLEKVGMLREAHTRELLPLKSGWSDNYGYAKLSTD